MSFIWNSKCNDKGQDFTDIMSLVKRRLRKHDQ